MIIDPLMATWGSPSIIASTVGKIGQSMDSMDVFLNVHIVIQRDTSHKICIYIYIINGDE